MLGAPLNIFTLGLGGSGSLNQPAGIYASNALGQKTYFASGAGEFSGVTFELTNYTLYYFEVDSEGVKYPVQSINVPSLSLGENAPIGIPSAHGNTPVNVILYGAASLVIDQSSGVAVGTIPTLTATISGGAWSSDNSDPITGITITPIVIGSNTIVATQTDPNGDTTESTSITIDYAEEAPIVEIDNQPAIIGDISTDKYLVSGAYLYGGSIVVDGNGDYVTDENGFLVKSGGTLVEFTDYALYPSGNNVQVTGLTDDFGNDFSTTIQLVIKIPAVQYVGPTTFNEEEDGRIVTVTNGLLIDDGAPYATYEDITFDFTGDDYGSVTKQASYSYPTGESNSVPVVITFNEFASSGLPQESSIIQNIEGIGDIINILTYDPANGYVFAEDVIGTSTNVNVFVDEGFSSATSFSYQLDFISLDYRNYTFNIPYTNPITLEIFYVEVTVQYKATLVYEDFATNLMHFGDPTGGLPASVTIINDTVDKYQDVNDLVEVGTKLTQATPADMPLVTVNAVGKNGAEMVISDVITMNKAYTGNEGWHTAEHCFVITFQIPTARGPYFEFPTIEMGSDTVLRFLDFGGGFKVGAQGTLGSISHTIRDYVTFLVGKDSAGDLRFYSSGGDDVNLGAFAGWSASDLILGNTDNRQTTDAIFYEITCIDHFPDATERTDIYSRSATKWETV